MLANQGLVVLYSMLAYDTTGQSKWQQFDSQLETMSRPVQTDAKNNQDPSWSRSKTMEHMLESDQNETKRAQSKLSKVQQLLEQPQIYTSASKQCIASYLLLLLSIPSKQKSLVASCLVLKIQVIFSHFPIFHFPIFAFSDFPIFPFSSLTILYAFMPSKMGCDQPAYRDVFQ